MQQIELELSIGDDGRMQLPAKYQTIYGKTARLMIFLPDAASTENHSFNPMDYSATIDWPMDGVKYQKQVRSEWK